MRHPPTIFETTVTSPTLSGVTQKYVKYGSFKDLCSESTDSVGF